MKQDKNHLLSLAAIGHPFTDLFIDGWLMGRLISEHRPDAHHVQVPRGETFGQLIMTMITPHHGTLASHIVRI